MKAIETTYNGTVFRSRIEARWAKLFSLLGLSYVYEPEGFEHCGERYLPDFWVDGWDTYVAIKPFEDFKKMTGGMKRELYWQGEMAGNGMSLYIIAGTPKPDGYVCLIPQTVKNLGYVGYVECLFRDCRRCFGLAIVSRNTKDGLIVGDIGTHKCGEHERIDDESERLEACMLEAMRERFGERQDRGSYPQEQDNEE